jgi:hypothetical protein
MMRGAWRSVPSSIRITMPAALYQQFASAFVYVLSVRMPCWLSTVHVLSIGYRVVYAGSVPSVG